LQVRAVKCFVFLKLKKGELIMNRNFFLMSLIFSIVLIFSISIVYGKCFIINESSPGSKVYLEDYIVPGKINIIDFYADWCGPCKKIAPYLEELDENRDDVVVFKVNIKEWDSPVCKQYNINSVPCFLIYDEKGNLKYSGDEAYEEVVNMINSM